LISSTKKYLLLIAGSLSLVLGIIGVLIPILPTTPFLLLASYCYLRSSKHMYDWLIHHRIFGEYIYNYLQHHAVKRNTKIGTLIFLWFSLSLSMIVVDRSLVRLLLIIVGIAVSTHILTLKTLNQNFVKGLSREGLEDLIVTKD
jgi:hypothetical protein